MDRDSPERVALFGGTFDPIHLGHVELLGSLEKSLLVDEIWILPSPDPPHKRGTSFRPYHHRLEMIRLAIEEFHLPVTICEVETSLPTPSFTIQTIRYLQTRYPRHRFFLSVGADSLSQFHTWKSYHELLERVPLLVARRPGCPLEELDPNILERTLFLDHTEVEISSSHVRRLIFAKRESVEQVQQTLPESVWSYIQEQNLYIRE